MGIAAILSAAALIIAGSIIGSLVAMIVGIGILVFIGAGIYFSG